MKIKTWPTKKLGEICSFQNGLWKGKKPPFKEVAVLRNTNFRNGGYLDLSNVAEIEVENNQLENRLLKRGDLLLERSGGGPDQPVGRVVYFNSDGPYSFSNFTTKIKIKLLDKIDSKYLWRYLNFLYLQGITRILQSQTTGIRNLNFSEYKNLEISLPPLSVQQKIVYVLDSIQDAVGVQEKIIERTKELKKSLMHKLFREGTKEKSKIKNQKSKLQFKIQKWVKLKEAAEIIMGQSPPSSSYNESMEGLPFLQGKAEFGETSPIPIKWCSEPIKIAQKGDVLISVRAPVGDVNLADQKYCIGRGLAAIHPKENFDNIYLFNYFQISKEKIENESTGSTFRAVGKNVLENFLIPLLSLSEQQEIAKILQTVDQKIEIEQKKKALYEELFKTMLNKIMSREIKVDNLNLKYAAKNRKKIS